ncbi:DnaB-like helicase N-terminal domain-containing protein [Streptomyces sp. NPDC086549]|uniref:DnaB-like helicase N-terminal domain-containing protein n=1 Tax=Streptomyces sp. NPDC086549 TaxID=3365752 RepID=UPI0038288380
MPRTREPDEDYLDTIPPPQRVFYAEQALLGALLLEPWRLGNVTGIGPEAFSAAVQAVMFAAIRSVLAPDPAQHAEKVSWLDAVLSSARKQARGLTISYLHTVIQRCPWPHHASAYAQMVGADHAHRTLRAQAHDLAQTARPTPLCPTPSRPRTCPLAAPPGRAHGDVLAVWRAGVQLPARAWPMRAGTGAMRAGTGAMRAAGRSPSKARPPPEGRRPPKPPWKPPSPP